MQHLGALTDALSDVQFAQEAFFGRRLFGAMARLLVHRQAVDVSELHAWYVPCSASKSNF